jgi:hypothetical protein
MRKGLPLKRAREIDRMTLEEFSRLPVSERAAYLATPLPPNQSIKDIMARIGKSVAA